MKKLFFSLVCLFAAMSISAQKGFTEKSNFGISVNAGSNFYSDYSESVYPIVQLSFNKIVANVSICSVSGDKYEGLSLGLSFGYLFNVINRLNVYPLVGGYYYKFTRGDEYKFNIGAGAQYNLFGNFYANVQGSIREVGGGLGFYF